MTLEEGKNLIARIDAEVVKNHSSIELAKMTLPLYDFVAYARSHNMSATARTVPTRALMYFFEDKKIGAMHERLSREREVNNVKELSYGQLVNLLEKVRPATSTHMSSMRMPNPCRHLTKPLWNCRRCHFH